MPTATLIRDSVITGTLDPVTERPPLPAGANLRWTKAWLGRLSTARGVAEVRLQSRSVRLTLGASPQSRGGALRANAFLPGNVRYAGPPDACHLVSDGWLAPEALQEAVRDFRTGARKTRPRARPWTPTSAGSTAEHEQLIERIEGSEAGVDVVPRSPGWELGVRVRGRRTAIHLSPETGGLRLYRKVVVTPSPDAAEPAAEPVWDAALRLNARVKAARFALHGHGLAVETRLSDRLLELPRLIESAHAVAVVCREFEPVLELLTRDQGVSLCYARVFHTNHQEKRA